MSVPTYTQHTVAFPNLPLNDHEIEHVGLTFAAGPGFSFTWHTLGGEPAMRLQAFQESFASLISDRMVKVLVKLTPQGGRAAPSPAELLRLLDQAGFAPSEYHVAGLVKRDGMSLEEKARLNERMEQA